MKDYLANIPVLKELPYFSIIGVLALIALFFPNLQGSVDFNGKILPTVLTEALLFITLGIGFLRKRLANAFPLFLMACVWFLNQVLVWNIATAAYLSAALWLLLVAQAALTYMYATNFKISFAGGGGDSWAYAGVWLLALFAIAKILLAPQYMAWGFAVGLVSVGTIFRQSLTLKQYGLWMQVIGVLVAVFAVLVQQSAALSLI